MDLIDHQFHKQRLGSDGTILVHMATLIVNVCTSVTLSWCIIIIITRLLMTLFYQETTTRNLAFGSL